MEVVSGLKEDEDDSNEKDILQVTIHSDICAGSDRAESSILPKLEQEDETNVRSHQHIKEEDIPVTISEELYFNASHPDWTPDRSRPPSQNLIIVKIENCSRSLDVSQELSQDDGEFPDLEQLKAPTDSESGKRVRTQENLSSINVLNPRVKPFACTECEKCFTQKQTLQIHSKIHKEENLHKCTECGKTFIAKSDLQRHYMCHTGEKPFTCVDCGKNFTRKSSLLTHQRVHTGEKPFKCMECGKNFAGKRDLQKHRIRHTGEKPFTCAECGKSFGHNSNFRRHQRIHTRV
ncbi:uncharacterized protein O3C94_006040 [Discoglossus pictus]